MPPSCTSRTGRPLISNRTCREVGACNASPGNPIMLRSVKYPETAARPGTRVRTSFNVVPPNRCSSSLVSTSTIAGASDCFSTRLGCRATLHRHEILDAQLSDVARRRRSWRLAGLQSDVVTVAHSRPQSTRRRHDSDGRTILPRYVGSLIVTCPESCTSPLSRLSSSRRKPVGKRRLPVTSRR